jgi:NitT/TauT family transport system permease protein
MYALKQVFAPTEVPVPDESKRESASSEPQTPQRAASTVPTAAPAVPAARGALRVRAVRAHAGTAALWVLSLSLLLAFWYVATRYKLDFYIRFTNIPTPAEVLNKLFEVNQSPKFLMNIGISVRRILIGFGIAMAVGIPLGLLIGRYKPFRDLLLPVCEVLRPIPAIAWVPMSIMLWPNNEASIVFITFLGSFFPILLNTIHGVESIDKVLVRAGQCLGAKEPALLWNVVLPGALPHIFTGLAVGMGVAWVSLIAAEMISGQFGVGYFTWEAYSLVNYAEIVLGMITIGVLGLACSGAIRGASRLAMPWLSYTTGKR